MVRGLLPVPVDSHRLHSYTFWELWKSLTSFASIYSSSTTPIAVTGLIENCSVGKEQSIPTIKLLPMRVLESASLQSTEGSLSQFV